MFNKSLSQNKYIFNKQIVYISTYSFKQNVLVANNIRKYVDINIKYENITTIGGEAYLTGLTNDKVKNIINYTNSIYIYNDVKFNNSFYKKINKNYLINYNKCKEIKNSDLLIINLANLNQNLIKIINYSNAFKEIIIINCHHKDFWKKIKLLDKYKLKIRKKFITVNNFITVNIFIKIPDIFISLGGNCSVAYQLKKFGLRNNAYPFDWCRMNISKLNKVLENNFENFSDIIIDKFSENHKLEDKIDSNYGSYILKNKYNIKFAHEIKNNDIEEIEKFKESIENRIKRFKDLNKKNITFILLNLENKNSNNLNLKNLLKNLNTYFTKFKLIYIELDKNIEYKIYDWKYSNIDWKYIFTQI